MKRVVLITLLCVCSLCVYSQSEKVFYRISDLEATYEPAGKEYFNPGDSITVYQISLFDIRRYIQGEHLSVETQRIEFLSGTYEISELYQLAKKTREENVVKTIGGKNFTPGAITRPAGDKSDNYTVASVVVSLKQLIDSSKDQSSNEFLYVVKKDEQIEINNNNSKQPFFVDVIWVKDNRCFSAISYAKDYVSYNPLQPNSSRVIVIDKYASAETLFVVGSSVPIAFNTINFEDYNNEPQAVNSEIVLSVVRVK